MAFDARNLRVQLPCGSVTVFPCRFNTNICFQFTYWTCRFYTWHCPFTSCFDSPICRWGTSGGCGFGSPVVDPGPEIDQVTHVSIDDIGALRELLQAQLKELDAAEKKVKAFEKEQG